MKYLIRFQFLLVGISMVLLMNGCVPASIDPLPTDISSQSESTLEANMPLPTDAPLMVSEVEELAGFDVKEPSYLPTGVSFDHAAYQKTPYPAVRLYFKLIHETYGDMGIFFQIIQTPLAEAIPNPTACGAASDECESIQVGDLTVKYHLTTPTESLMWDADGFSFQLLRNAGEPDKTYKDELLKVVGSMK